MQTYVILRRNAFKDGPDLEAAAARSTKVGDEDMPNDVKWIRSYVLGETIGGLGTVCIYQATSADAVRRHAAAAGLACDEVIEVADTVVIRGDPQT
jgi:hypothetical protein